MAVIYDFGAVRTVCAVRQCLETCTLILGKDGSVWQ
jgi:hypothetical protein